MADEREESLQAARPVIETRFIAAAFSGVPAVRALTPEESQICARRMLADAKGAKEIDNAMRQRGLVGMVSRARAYTPHSRTRGCTKTVVVVPYTSTDPDATVVGGIGVSEGEPVSGIVVELRGTQIARFTTLDMIAGALVEREISAKELIAEGPRRFVEDQYPRGALPRDLTIDTSASIASDAFKVLLFDDHSLMVHTQADLRKLVFNAPLVSAIAELQYMRLEGLTTSPDGSCCCCCCCCWGSCSSCSAVSTKYVNESYRQRWT